MLTPVLSFLAYCYYYYSFHIWWETQIVSVPFALAFPQAFVTSFVAPFVSHHAFSYDRSI